MVGIHYSHHHSPFHSYPCHQCGGQIQANKTHRTFHLCGIPLIPLRSDTQLICWSCGYNVFLPSERNRYYPGRRNIGDGYSRGWRGRKAQWDRREDYTYRFWPRFRRYRYRYGR